MSTAIPAPDLHALIPPLLAILPASFASSRPPPALLPLLSPILQQRITLHTSNSGSQHDSWLRLLCWDGAKADSLKDQVENANFEPHPSSGEIELGDVETIKYRRFDAETLRAQIALIDWDMTVLFVWCTGGDGGDAWRLAELLPFDSDLLANSTWFTTIGAANEAVTPQQHLAKPASLERQVSMGDDDDYWAMYDGTPGRTPAPQDSVNPTSTDVPEDDYYARYGDIQPALDGHDPDEATEEMGQTSLSGGALEQMLSERKAAGERQAEDEDVVHVSHPVPSAPSSRAGSDTVARLEETAERFTASDIAIRQHISTSMKSMYRLAKASGMSRDDFDRMVQRELETLSILDADE